MSYTWSEFLSESDFTVTDTFKIGILPSSEQEGRMLFQKKNKKNPSSILANKTHGFSFMWFYGLVINNPCLKNGSLPISQYINSIYIIGNLFLNEGPGQDQRNRAL